MTERGEPAAATADLRARAEAYLALAEKATPGPWRAEQSHMVESRHEAIAMTNLAAPHNWDTQFIAASHDAAQIIREFLRTTAGADRGKK